MARPLPRGSLHSAGAGRRCRPLTRPHKAWIVRPDGPAVYYNSAMREFAGEVLKLPHRSGRERALVHPEDLPAFIATREAAIADKRNWTFEARLKCPDGGWRWHRLDFATLRSGDVDAWLAVATDIHDLKLAMLAAQQSGEQFRLAAEAARLGVYSFDLQTGEHVWSRRHYLPNAGTPACSKRSMPCRTRRG